MSCFFSIIIPVYNAEKYLHQCVQSVLSQTFTDFEVILVNDGSKDNSPQICDEYAKTDPRVKVIHKENGGLSSARNAGINLAQGEFLLFLDSDDFLYTDDSIEELYISIKKTTPDVMFFKSYKYYQPDKFVDYYGDYDLQSFLNLSPVKIFFYMVKENKQFACAWNKAVRRCIIEENELFFENGVISEDVEWCVKLFAIAEKVDALNKVIHIYRQGVSTSITASCSEKKLNDLYYIISKISEKYKEQDEEFANTVKSFMAFEYAILLFNISSFDDYKKYKFVSEYKWLLKYALDKKTKAVKYAYNILGFRGLMTLLRLKRRAS